MSLNVEGGARSPNNRKLNQGVMERMRHVRILGMTIAAFLALAAAGTSSALAVKNPTKSAKIFVNCPVNGFAAGLEEARPDLLCIFGATEPGEGGQFRVGKITVPLSKQIVLQYGAAIANEKEEEVINEKGEGTGGSTEYYIPPTHGAEAITPTPERVPGEPIANITTTEQ